MVLKKQTAISEIPGLRYQAQAVANMPRQATWDDRKLSPAVRQSIRLVARGSASQSPLLPMLKD